MSTSCSLFEPASPQAAFIHIDSVSVYTDYPTQGSNSNRLPDAWVFLDGKYLGTFPLPADVPLIGEGNHVVSVKGGIIENGVSGSRAAYPKYITYDTTLNLSSGITAALSPRVTYGSGIQFAQIEDFDDASLSLQPTSSGSSTLLITPPADPNAFETNSGFTIMDSAKPSFEVATASPFILPLNVPSYLELDYKCEADFSIGVFITTTTGIIKSELVTARATSVWKKIYVTLSTLGGVVNNGLDYKIYLRSEKPSGMNTATLYFDNLKVLY